MGEIQKVIHLFLLPTSYVNITYLKYFFVLFSPVVYYYGINILRMILLVMLLTWKRCRAFVVFRQK